jgi:hypothetical protein
VAERAEVAASHKQNCTSHDSLSIFINTGYLVYRTHTANVQSIFWVALAAPTVSIACSPGSSLNLALLRPGPLHPLISPPPHLRHINILPRPPLISYKKSALATRVTVTPRKSELTAIDDIRLVVVVVFLLIFGGGRVPPVRGRERGVLPVEREVLREARERVCFGRFERRGARSFRTLELGHVVAVNRYEAPSATSPTGKKKKQKNCAPEILLARLAHCLKEVVHPRAGDGRHADGGEVLVELVEDERHRVHERVHVGRLAVAVAARTGRVRVQCRLERLKVRHPLERKGVRVRVGLVEDEDERQFGLVQDARARVCGLELGLGGGGRAHLQA